MRLHNPGIIAVKAAQAVIVGMLSLSAGFFFLFWPTLPHRHHDPVALGVDGLLLSLVAWLTARSIISLMHRTADSNLPFHLPIRTARFEANVFRRDTASIVFPMLLAPVGILVAWFRLPLEGHTVSGSAVLGAFNTWLLFIVALFVAYADAYHADRSLLTFFFLPRVLLDKMLERISLLVAIVVCLPVMILFLARSPLEDIIEGLVARDEAGQGLLILLSPGSIIGYGATTPGDMKLQVMMTVLLLVFLSHCLMKIISMVRVNEPCCWVTGMQADGYGSVNAPFGELPAERKAALSGEVFSLEKKAAAAASGPQLQYETSTGPPMEFTASYETPDMARWTGSSSRISLEMLFNARRLMARELAKPMVLSLVSLGLLFIVLFVFHSAYIHDVKYWSMPWWRSALLLIYVGFGLFLQISHVAVAYQGLPGGFCLPVRFGRVMARYLVKRLQRSVPCDLAYLALMLLFFNVPLEALLIWPLMLLFQLVVFFYQTFGAVQEWIGRLSVLTFEAVFWLLALLMLPVVVYGVFFQLGQPDWAAIWLRLTGIGLLMLVVLVAATVLAVRHSGDVLPDGGGWEEI